MKTRTLLLGLIVLSVTLSGCQPREEIAIQKAISKVYPALVFVKPIQQDLSRGEESKYQVFGSGSIISPEGYIVTNNHVAEKAEEITCVLYNKREVKAEVVGLDPESDIAVLKLDSEELAEVMAEEGIAALPVAEWGDSDTVVEGQAALALGAPFGFTRSVTKGIVSSTERYFAEFKHHLWIQTDASINPGNSGGPLVNLDGTIVGINTLGIMGSGIGFSIPSNVARQVAERIIADGEVKRSYFGLTLQAIHDFTRSSHLKADRGVLIANIDRASPAQEAGIQAGDILLSVNGEPTDALYETGLPAIIRKLAFLPIGEEYTFTVKRDKEELTYRVVSKLKGKFEGDEFECKAWNCVMKGITKDSTPYFHFLKPHGVFVLGVKYQGNAANSGMMRGDIIVSIDGEPVESLEKLKEIYESLAQRPKGDRKVPVVVNRGGLEVLLILDYELDVKAVEEEYE
ncbi:MAG: trypsin-like peptidase domain-containing protein [Planctomycetota bacterium]|nr:trypsin-like peptidase domain-containing protein [Planctomycetota bacterium]